MISSYTERETNRTTDGFHTRKRIVVTVRTQTIRVGGTVRTHTHGRFARKTGMDVAKNPIRKNGYIHMDLIVPTYQQQQQ